MTEKLIEFLLNLMPYVITLGIGISVSAIFYYWMKREIFGGFIGGTVVAFIGALLGGFGLDFFLEPVKIVLEFLVYKLRVNTIAGTLGAVVFLLIMSKLNHNKKRSKF